MINSNNNLNGLNSISATTISATTFYGDAVIDLWKDTYANFPPTSADTITASARPTLSSAVKGQSSTLTGWTTAVAAGDGMSFTTITSTGSVTMGTPSTITGSTTNSVSSGTHTHTLGNLGNAAATTVSASSTFTGTNFIMSSDRRLKQNIKPLFLDDNGIQFVNYTFKSDTTNRIRIGVIAQDLEVKVPELVYTDKSGMKSVDYTGLLLAKIIELENRIKALENEK